MDGGEIEWRDENDQPVLDIQEVRSIFRDVVCGLDYCKYLLIQFILFYFFLR